MVAQPKHRYDVTVGSSGGAGLTSERGDLTGAQRNDLASSPAARLLKAVLKLDGWGNSAEPWQVKAAAALCLELERLAVSRDPYFACFSDAVLFADEPNYVLGRAARQGAFIVPRNRAGAS